MDVIHIFDHGALRHPQRACFITETATHSYAEVKRLSERIARRLRGQGIGRGRQAAVLSINDPVGFTCVLGALRAGATWVPLNPRSAAAEQIHLLNAFEVEILFFHSALAPLVDAIRPQLATTRLFVCIDLEHGDAPALPQWLGDVEAGDVEREVDADACAAIAGTGGTTGLPKGVMLTHRNFETFAASYAITAPSEQPPVHLLAAPMTHAAGMLCFPMFLRGGTNVILQRPEPQSVLEAIQRHRVTDLFLPPTVIYMLLAQPNVRDFDFSSLRYFVYGAAPMSVDKLREALAVFGPVMLQAFGQTEAPMLCCALTPTEHFEHGQPADDARLASCGRATAFTEVAIMGESGALLPDGERGEIVVRGDLVSKGYFRNAQATAEVRVHGWHRTGDIGWRDADGYLYIVDRKKDMIISGGFNIYSAEVEQAVLAHPAVLDCAVIGVPDDKWGEAVKAVVQLKPGAQVTSDELIAHCHARLGGVKTPKTVEIWAELPRSTVGKVLKRDIRNRYWNGRDRAVA